MATLYVFADEAAKNAAINDGSGIYTAENTFIGLANAVNAASATEATTITVAAGTYAEDITLDARSMEQKGDIKFVAADGAAVVFSGKLTIGYYEKRVGSKAWDANVEIEGITFDQATAATHSIDIQQVNDFTMTNCTVIGDGEYGISGTNVDNGATITGCTFKNAGIQSAGSFGTNLLIDGCTFDDSKLNLQSGNGAVVSNTTFNSTLKDANVGDSFYAVRTNDVPVTINGCTFNVDSELAEVAANQEKWGLLWQRNAGSTKWTVTAVEINLTDAAMLQTELMVNKNATTTAANAADRISINGVSSTDNDVADIFAKSEGYVKVTDDGVYTSYFNGEVELSYVVSKFFVDAAFTGETGAKVGEGKYMNINAFADWNSAVAKHGSYAVANQGELQEIIVSGTVESTTSGKLFFYTNGDVVFSAAEGTTAVIDASSNSRFYLMDTLMPNGSSVVSGTDDIAKVTLNSGVTLKVGSLLNLGQAINDDDVDENGAATRDGGSIHLVIKDGAVLESEAVYVNSYSTLDVEVGGKIIGVAGGQESVIRGNATVNITGNGDNTVQWMQNNGVWVSLQGGTINLTDTVVDWNTVKLSGNSGNVLYTGNDKSTIKAVNSKIYSYAMEIAEGAEVSLTNSVLNLTRPGDDGNITNNGKLVINSGSSLVANKITGSGSIIIDATGFTGFKKIIDLSTTGSLEGKVTILGDGIAAIYGDDGDVSIAEVSCETVYVNSAYNRDNGVVLGDGKYFGINAFNDFESALAAAAGNSTVTRIEIESDLVQNGVVNTSDYYIISQKLTIGTAGDADFKVTITPTGADSVAVLVNGNGASLTIEDGVDINWLDVVADGYWTRNEEMIIDGKLSAKSLKIWTSNNGVTVNETGKVDLGHSDGQLDWNYGNGSLTVNGSLTDTADASLTGGPQVKAGYSTVQGNSNGGTLNLNNTYFEGGSWFNAGGKNFTANVDNSVLKVSGGDAAGSLTVNGSNNVFNIDNGSRLIVANASVADTNKIAVDSSSLEIGTLTNKGAVEVTGESTLKINTLSGSSIDLLDGAIIKDSTVGGTLYVAGNVVFRGDNVFNMITDYGTYYAGTYGANAQWTVEAGASVKLTKGVYGLGYGDNVTVNGEFIDAKAAYNAGLTDDDASFIINGSFTTQNNSAGKNTTNYFTVNNAYVRISDAANDQSLKSHDTDNYGKYEFKFTNSVVAANAFNFNYAENGGTYDFTVKNSVFTSGLFRYETLNSTFKADNSVIKSTGNINSIGGTLELTNNSEFTAADGKTVANGGTIKVQDSSFTATNVQNGSKMFEITLNEASSADRNLTVWAVDDDGNIIADSGVAIRVVKNDKVFSAVVNGSAASIIIKQGDTVIDSATYTAAVVSTGTFEVSGESTLKIDTLSGSSIDLLDGAIIKDSTVGGNAFVAGNVTFRGDNTFAMLYDYGTLTDYYGTTAPMKWTVEAGASLTLTNTARYGLGYGDDVTINGNIAANGASAARATLTDDDADNDVKQSLFMHGLVAQESTGWDCSSSFTVNNAFVTIGSNNSFGNKPGNYGGTYTFNFNNSVLNGSRITFYEALSTTAFTFKDSDVEIGTFMTRDQDSVFTLDNTVLLSTATSNGNDEGNYNAAKLNVINGSTLTYSCKMFNEATGVINVDNAIFVAPEIVNNNVIYLNNGTLEFGSMNTTTAGQLYVNGESVISGDSISGGLKLRIGQVDANGDGVADGMSSGNKLTLNVDSITVNFANINYTDVILVKDVAFTTTGKNGAGEKVNFSYISSVNSTYDLNGYTLTVGGGFMVGGAEFSNGKVVFDGSLGTTHKNMVFQDYASTVAADAVIEVQNTNGTVVSIYEDLTVNGKYVDTRTSGNAINVGLTSVYYKSNDDNAKDYTDGANLVVSGTGAEFSAANINMHVHASDSTLDIEASSLTIANGGKVTVAKLINDGSIAMDATGSLVADTITGDGTITIDATGFEGYKKVIDLAGNSSLEGKVTVLGDGITAIYGADGDVTVTDADMSTFFVNAAFTGETGTKVADGLYVGVNAFGNAADAVAGATADTSKIVVNGGTLNTSYFGGYTTEILAGTKLADGVMIFGGDWAGAVDSVNLTLTDVAAGDTAYIFASYEAVTNDVVITVNQKAGSQLLGGSGGIWGGAYGSEVGGNVTLNINGTGVDEAYNVYENTSSWGKLGRVNGRLVGGGYYGTVKGNVTINASNVEFNQRIVGGGEAADGYDATVEGNVTVNVNNVRANYGIVGGGLKADVAGNVAVNADQLIFANNAVNGQWGSERGWIIGGGFNGNVGGDVTMKLNEVKAVIDFNGGEDGKNQSTIIAGGYNGDVAGDVTMSLTDVKSELIYGAGYNGNVGGNVDLSFNNVNASEIYVGGYNSTVAGTIESEFTGKISAEKVLEISGNASVNNAEINAGSIINNGTITIDSTSSLVAETLTGSGTITINATGFTSGTKSVIDLNGSVSLKGKVTVNGLEEGINVVYGKDGDVMLTDQSKATIYVNNTWAGSNAGDTVGNGYLYGYNAAGTLAEVGNMINTDGSDTTIKFESDLETGTVEFKYGNGDITFTADSAVTIKQTALGSDWAFTIGKDMTITVGENVTFEIYDNASGWYQYYGPGLELYGTITGGQNWGCAYLFNGEHNVYSTGTMSVGRLQIGFADFNVIGEAGSDRTSAHVDTNYLLVEGGTFTASNAIIEVGAVHDSNNGGQRWGASEFSISGSKFTANSVTLKYADSTFDVSNSVLTVGTFANNGKVTVSGNTELNGAFSGNNITFANGTVLTSTTGASFAGSYTVKTMSFGQGEFTFNGMYYDNLTLNDGATVTVNGTLASYDGDTLTVNAGAELAASSIYFNGGNIVVNGKLTSVVGADGGFILNGADDTITVNAGAEINVTYIDIYKTTGNSTVDVYGDVVSTFKLNDGSGKFTWNIYAGASLTAEKQGIVMNNAASVINLTDGDLAFANLNSAGTITMDLASTISFAAITNAGTITIDMTNLENSFGNKLFDYTGSNTSSWTIDSYKAVISNWSSDMDKYFVVVDGDLCVKTKKVVYVNGSYTDASQNQFKTHEEAVASGADTIITTGGTVGSKVDHEGIAAVIEGGTFNATVYGGAITSSGNFEWDQRDGNTNMTITAGTFNKSVFGGDRIDGGNTVRIGNVNTTITGGTFKYSVTGGMYYAVESLRGQAMLIGDVNLTIAGGTFGGIIYGGNAASSDSYSARTVMEGNVNITIDATNAIKFNAGSKIIAGSYRFGSIDGNVTVTITGLASNIAMHNNFEIWGGCSSDGYLAGSDRVFQTNISGDRTISFADYQGSFNALIRGFETLEIVDGSQVSLNKSNLSDIKNWVFEAGSTLTGALNNNFAKDTLEIDVTDWNDSSCDLVVGDAVIFNGVTSLASVTVGSETLTFDGVSKWASASYELEYKDGEDGKKVLALSKLA